MIRALIVVLIALSSVASAHAQTPLQDQFFDSNGAKIRYVDMGRGDPVLLFHAMSESVDTWRGNGVLDALAGDFRVIAFDLRGHGKSDKPRDPGAYGVQPRADLNVGRIICDVSRIVAGEI
jgi:pimeloyl-ACP methyl ester carboxylesterase